ncbi:hypothetical protein [Cecembia rubra]|nr:hypothetical protein [Cecembia rubra]
MSSIFELSLALSNLSIQMKQLTLPHPAGFIRFLFFYHVAFAFIFTWYLNEYGGDAIRYWQLSAETSHHPQSWADHFGTRTYFIQWLNYLPSKVLGFPFWLGNVIYALVSFLALRILFGMVINILPPRPNPWTLSLLYLVFLLPNLHFWTSGIGKESLSLLGLVLFLKGTQNLKTSWYLLTFGILLSFFVRPLQGALLLGIALPVVCFEKGIHFQLKLLIIPIWILVGWHMLQFLLYITHMEGISPTDIMGFSEEQLSFLDQFAAGSSIPMESYSWPMKLWTLYFRPMPGESADFWRLIAGIENSISLAFFLLPLIFFRKMNWTLTPSWIYWAVLFGFTLMLVYGITLNNLGIIMRMKSFFMIYFHLMTVALLSNLKLENNI